MKRREIICRSALAVLLSGLFTVFVSNWAIAQVTVMGPNGKPMTLSPEQMKAMRKGGMMPGQPQPGQPAAQPAQEAKPDDKKKEGEDGKKKEADATLKRPEKPPVPPDPKEFKVTLDKNGRMPAFSFNGQPWPDVMQWLATNSKCSLQWQELPNGYLNITTRRSYSIDEVRDLINRQLLALGYISIRSNDDLSVFKVDKIDPSLVRQCKEVDLYSLQPHDFAKVAFEVPASMEVDKAKEDVKAVVNANAKIFPLISSRQLLVMDSVANLRTVSQLFNEERMVQDGRIVPKEYFLKHARPQQVIEVLYMMLGMDPKGRPQQTDPNQQQQQMAMMQQMQQQGRAAEAQKMMQNAGGPKVYLAYNRQRNSVLVNAPPEQLKIIERTIAYLDVPYGVAAGGADGAGGNSERVFHKYTLATLDPDKFKQTLEQIGGLSPYTELQTDDNAKTLYALASEADQKKIESLLHDFDGSGRQFEVIWLRRHAADAVAATIYKMMGGQTEKKEDNNRRRWYSWYDDYGNDNKKKDTIQGFGVDADVENNRLLLWATAAEMDKVRELLMKLGEMPNGQQDPRPVRVVEPGEGKPVDELIKELRQAWSATGSNELIIDTSAAPKEKKEKKEAPKGEKSTSPAKDRSASTTPRNRIAAHFVQLSGAAANNNANAPAPPSTNSAIQQPTNGGASTKPAETGAQPAGPSRGPAPVKITVTPDGRLVISSPDTAALDRMEQLIAQMAPQQRRFKVYPLTNIRAIDMWWDLQDFFKEDLEAKDKKDEFYSWWWGGSPSSNDKGPTGMAKRKKLMISYDTPSNSIFVANASPSQLTEVEQLIQQFDRPTRKDSVELRQTAPIKVLYSRPSIIANAIKEVYRDLLSSRDKEFQNGDQKDKRGRSERVTIIDYPGASSGEGNDRPSPLKISFDGALSLGPDDVSGVLIVSAQPGIFKDVVEMVHQLDEQAKPQTTVQVYRVGGSVSAEALKKTLEQAVSKPWLGNKPEQGPNQTGGEPDKQRHEKDRGNRNQEGGDKNK
jgi:type II secretory pathway component GspD/PulD (secretin)